MATTNLSPLMTSFTSLNGPSQPPVKSSLSFPSSISTDLICLRATQLINKKARVIVRGGGNGGRGGGGSGGDHGEGEGEGEAEEKRFEELPMLGWPSWWLKNGLLKDQEELEEEDSLGWQEMTVQLYEEFDDGFWADDMFSSSKAKAIVPNFRLFYLPGPVSLSPPIEVNAGSIAEIMYACPDKELQAKDVVANFCLFDRPGIGSFSLPIEVNAGSLIEILYACPDKELQAKARLLYLPGPVSLSLPTEVNAGSVAEIMYAVPDKELQADVDGDGALKFVHASFYPGKLANDELLKKAFAFFVLNKSGHIGLKEVINAMTHIV